MDIIATLEKEEIERLGKKIPVFAPGDTVIVNVNVVEGERRGDVRRAKLYYLRDRSGKSARIREKLAHTHKEKQG